MANFTGQDLLSIIQEVVEGSDDPLSISEIEQAVRTKLLTDKPSVDTIQVQRTVKRLIESGKLVSTPSFLVKARR
jgi:hypothetical protein